MKKIILTFVANLAVLTLLAQIPIAHYPFNGNANDTSGNNLDGIVTGATLDTNRFGNDSSAYSFDGIDDVITIADNDLLDLTNYYSISLWVNPVAGYGSGTNYNHLLGKWGSTGDASYLIDIRNTGKLQFTVNDGVTNYNLPSTDTIETNTWSHIVFVQDSQVLRMYINDVLTDTATGIATPDTTSSPILIGNSPNGLEHFAGVIDDIQIFNIALSHDDVDDLYLDGVGICYETVYDTVTAYDTTWVNDTTTVMVYDTTYTIIYDTVTFNDTSTTFISVTDTLIIDVTDSTTSIPTTLNGNHITIYPNPAKNILFVESIDNSNLTNYTYKIYNNSGQLVDEGDFTTSIISIDISVYSKGLYYFNTYDGTSITNHKKIVIK
ncbi:T9SS type A sorting domain-containing protein [Sphingobacteriaceae bacterium AH-315-L07]|nr:T9SS type A sorting domain-containing protein [Sphingobacteriaceae bacterium AH-315-L07]